MEQLVIEHQQLGTGACGKLAQFPVPFTTIATAGPERSGSALGVRVPSITTRVSPRAAPVTNATVRTTAFAICQTRAII
jgi:hypothetical protein